MKRTKILVLLMAMVLGIAGCGNDTERKVQQQT